MKKETTKEIWKYPYKTAGMIWGGAVYTCPFCGKEIEGFKDHLSVQEFKISGLCQECQDKTFTPKQTDL